MYTKIELRELIHERLNEMDRTDFGENIWEVEDADEILLWLQTEGYIKECIWPWHKKIDRKKKIPANP